MGKIEIEITKQAGGLITGGFKRIVVRAEDRKDIDEDFKILLLNLK